MNFSAVLLAGGESRRMGADKPTLEFRDKPLWRIQFDLLGQLRPVEIFVSARTKPAWNPATAEFIADEEPSRGPLSGLAAALPRIKTKHLLVLAVDMPFMSEEHLRLLCDKIEPGRGVIPTIENRFEPLAAIYPVEAAVDIHTALAGTDFSMRTLANTLVKAGKLRVVPVAAEQRISYQNLNEPADMWRENIKIVKRVIIAVIGFTVLLIGVALLVLPGPAVIVIPIGLAILATEFAWARLWLKKIRKVVGRVVSREKSQTVSR